MNTIVINNTITDGIFQELNYLQNVLGGIKGKSHGIRLLVKNVQEIIEKLEKGEELFWPMLNLLAGLDGALEAPGEQRNRDNIQKAI